MTTPDRMRELVLVGGGHAHVQVLKAFGDDPPPNCRVTVVVDEPVAMYSGMVPGFVAGQYRTEELQIDARPLAALCGARAIVAQATRVDPETRLIELDGHEPVPFDFASFNIGSTVAGLNLPGVREHALPTRPITAFVRRIDEIIARRIADDDGAPLCLVIVGGGAGGVEVAFTAQHRLAQNLRGPVSATIVHDRSDILTGYPPAVLRRIHRHARARGITFRHLTRVDSVSPEHVVLENGDQVPFDLLLWVTGPTSHPFFVDSGLPVDERGFVRIRSTLQLEEHDNLFAVGDCATLIAHPDTPKAGVYAVREGPFITHNLRAVLAGESLHTYTPQHDFLMLLNLGGGYACGAKWGLSFAGHWVNRWKDRIDCRFMVQYQIRDEADARE